MKASDLEEAKRVGPFMRMVRGSDDMVTEFGCCLPLQLSYLFSYKLLMCCCLTSTVKSYGHVRMVFSVIR